MVAEGGAAVVAGEGGAVVGGAAAVVAAGGGDAVGARGGAAIFLFLTLLLALADLAFLFFPLDVTSFLASFVFFLFGVSALAWALDSDRLRLNCIVV